MPKTYREGPTGALMDEYERAANDLKALILPLDTMSFIAILDSETADPDCRSIQAITKHVVLAGYGYATFINEQFNETPAELRPGALNDAAAGCKALDDMLAYTEATLKNKADLSFEDVLKSKRKIKWGQEYDFEQILEHAIVHILRHRRQMERLMQRKVHNS